MPICIGNHKKQYCELDFWHDSCSNSLNDDKCWISQEGHKFTCKHQIPCHTIFIIDKSGSMERDDIKPITEIISLNKNFDKRMGKLIENMNNYIQTRYFNNHTEDVFSLVSFSDNASIIFRNKSMMKIKENFINEWMNRIEKCDGETIFL